MEFLDGSWKKEVSSWDALMGEELLNQEAILEGAIHSIRNMGDVAFVRFKPAADFRNFLLVHTILFP